MWPCGGRRALTGESGQATVEFVALVPILAGVALLVGGLLAGQRAREAADAAAVAAAIAALQGRDPQAAAQAAAPGWSRVRLRTSEGVARVELRWKGPRALVELIDAERSVGFEPGARP